MSIVFSKAALSDLTLEHGRMLPYDVEDIQINQENYLTESLNPKVVDYGGSVNFIKLDFRYLSKDNYDGTVNGLKTWFASTAINYCANNFTMTDEKGGTHTVRLWQNKFTMSNDVANRYGISLILLEE